MRRRIPITLATALTFSVAGSAIAYAQTETQQALSGAEIRFLQPAMPQFAALERFIPEFEEKFGIKVTVDEIPFDQYRQRSLVEMQQGTGTYDIYAVDVMWLAEYATAGFLEPLMPMVRNEELTDPDYDIDDFLPRVISGTGVWDDVLYTIPLGAGPVGNDLPQGRGRRGGHHDARALLARIHDRLHARGGDKGPQSRIRHDGLCADAWPLVLGHHLPALSLCLPDAGDGGRRICRRKLEHHHQQRAHD